MKDYNIHVTMTQIMQRLADEDGDYALDELVRNMLIKELGRQIKSDLTYSLSNAEHLVNIECCVSVNKIMSKCTEPKEK